MDVAAHLPLIAFDARPWTLARLSEYVRMARELGYAGITVNDHLVFPRPWLDGFVALAATLQDSGDMELMTTVAIPVVRGPLQTAKALAAIDILSGGRLTVGVGPGSSAVDYAAVGIPFEERWKRLDECIAVMRDLFRAQPAQKNASYPVDGLLLQPASVQADGPPIWIGSWGSDAGLRRVARSGDGWLASAYNTTPDHFAEAWQRLGGYLTRAGKSRATFPNAIATMFTYITNDPRDARRVLEGMIAETIRRPPEELAERLLVGTPEVCAERLQAYLAAGAKRVCIWPVSDELRQLELMSTKVLPLVQRPADT